MHHATKTHTLAFWLVPQVSFFGKIFTTWQQVAKKFCGKNAPKSPDL
jgi:hypothetical protein